MVMVLSNDFQHILGAADLDQDFRRRLFADPDATLKEDGHNLSASAMTRLKAALLYKKTVLRRSGIKA